MKKKRGQQQKTASAVSANANSSEWEYNTTDTQCILFLRYVIWVQLHVLLFPLVVGFGGKDHIEHETLSHLPK